MTKNKTKSTQCQFEDSYIREVRVNYLPTTTIKFRIKGPECVARFVRSVLLDNSREQFLALYLDGAHNVASYSIVSVGAANQATIHPREIFQRAILAGAIAITIAHNHPSDNVEPSKEDIAVTNRLRDAGILLGITLLDHVIVSDSAFASLREDIRCWP